MEKFYEIFRRDLKTKRLELRVLQPTPENARLVWDAIQNENPGDFKYVNWTPDYKKPLPESLDETLKQMQQEQERDVNPNGAVWYVFHNGKLMRAAQNRGLAHADQLKLKPRALEVLKSEAARRLYESNYHNIALRPHSK